jgi:uncharacterized BrkB/YihY/UPF0761 family membrane protein
MTARRRPWSDRATRILAWAAVAWTVAIGLAMLVVPTGTSVAVASNGSEVVATTSHETLLEHEGPSVVGFLLVPFAVALAGALGRGPTVRRRRIAAGSVLAVACVVGATTLGVFYVPAAAALLTAGLKART